MQLDYAIEVSSIMQIRFSRTSREMTNGRESGNLLACLPTPAFTPPYRLR